MNIQPILNTAKGIYEIENYENVLNSAKEFVEGVMKSQPVQIIDKDTLKVVKDSRTELRTRKEEITKARLQINEIYFGTFNSQLKEIEKLLKEADDKLKANVDAYNESIGNVKPKIYKVEISGYDLTSVNKIIDLAKQLNLQIKENKK